MSDVIRAVIYDLDDTVYDFMTHHPVATELLGDAAAKLLGCDKEAFLKIYNGSYDALKNKPYFREDQCVGNCHSRTLRLEYTLETMGLPQFPAVLDLYDVYWGYILDHMQAEPKIHETMAALKAKGVRIGIGTNMTARMQYKKLTRIDLGKYIDFIVTSEECIFDKPDPLFFDLVAKKAGCPRENCLFIGDNLEFDCKGAITSGMHGFWYDPKHRFDEEMAKETGLREDQVIHDHSEIFSRCSFEGMV